MHFNILEYIVIYVVVKRILSLGQKIIICDIQSIIKKFFVNKKNKM